MDFFRLPSSLRRIILSRTLITSPLLRPLSSAVQPIAEQEHVPSSSPALLTLSSTTLNSYNVGIPPSSAQLKYAHNFFVAAPPSLLFSGAYFRSLPRSPSPEVAFLGRSNVGKSSLLNALFGRTNVKDAHVSKRPGRTRTMNGFGVSGGTPLGEGEGKEAAWKRFPIGGLVVMDMPGYGAGSKEDWGREAMKYLEQRKQLRRTFVLVDAEHGLKKSDVTLLTHLRRRGIGHQIVLSKVDKLLYPAAKMPGPQKLHNNFLKLHAKREDMRRMLDLEAGDGREAVGDVLCCSAEKSLDEKSRHRKLGVDEVRWAVLSACGMECDEAGYRRKQSKEDFAILE